MTAMVFGFGRRDGEVKRLEQRERELELQLDQVRVCVGYDAALVAVNTWSSQGLGLRQLPPCAEADCCAAVLGHMIPGLGRDQGTPD